MSRRAFAAGVVAGAAALIAMVAVALGAVLLLGADGSELPRLVALVVAAALGVPIELGGAVDTGFLPARIELELSAMPLGVSLAGAVTMAATGALLRRRATTRVQAQPQLRARPQPQPQPQPSPWPQRQLRPVEIVMFVVGAIGGFALLLAPVLALGGSETSAPTPSGTLRPGDVSGLVQVLGEPRADASATWGHALLWLAVVLAVVVVGSRAVSLPGEYFRRAVVSVAAVFTGVAGLLTAVAAAIAGFAAGPAAAGATLLGGPNVVLTALTRGLGADWRLDTGGLPAGVGAALRDRIATGLSDPSSVPTGTEAALDVPGALLTVAAAAVLLLCGTLAAARPPAHDPAPAPSRDPAQASARTSAHDTARRPGRDPVRTAAGDSARTPAHDPGRVLWCAAALGVTTALALAVATVLARVSLDVHLSIGEFAALDAGLGLRASVPRIALVGLVSGAAAGALGVVLVDAARRTESIWRLVSAYRVASVRRVDRSGGSG
ncbi:streptophobe family protein [Cryptosporangium aurantiacum]|uniref:Uncharacterized protein n=1 Tax=Cryptosporangium aurantiacum TaxID=134849 RepID=A0A1M7RNX1_9ACTN|nr:streptophobe family protein [Cryptosporangium aurantiacum]SHN47758.1 hypothetical protein SAMN05443668_12761 [Cryptosporangium aurantiacum]